MDLHRYQALIAQWRRSPPLQQMVQAYLGIEPLETPPDEPQRLPTPEEEGAAIADFARNFAAAGGIVN